LAILMREKRRIK